MRNPLWSDEAVANLFDIADFYRHIDPDLPDLLLARIMDAPKLLLERPLLGAPSGQHGLRKWSVRQTPFVLLYRVVDGGIEIVEVVHAAQNWLSE